MNQKRRRKKKKKKKNVFEFCKVCNLNHDQAQRDKYFPNHKKTLSVFFSRFRSKLADIRFFLKNPSALRPEHASRNHFWCVFRDADVDVVGSSFACGNGIHHLTSLDHLKNLKHFLWKHGGGIDSVDSFRISDAGVVKWEKKCNSLRNEAASATDRSHVIQVGPSNDEYQISHSGHPVITNAGQFIHDAVSSLPSDMRSGTRLWNSNELKGNWTSHQSHHYNSAICTDNHSNGGPHQVFQEESMVKRVSSSQGLMNISQMSAQISAMAPEKVGENVHTGHLLLGLGR